MIAQTLSHQFNFASFSRQAKPLGQVFTKLPQDPIDDILAYAGVDTITKGARQQLVVPVVARPNEVPFDAVKQFRSQPFLKKWLRDDLHRIFAFNVFARGFDLLKNLHDDFGTLGFILASPLTLAIISVAFPLNLAFDLVTFPCYALFIGFRLLQARYQEKRQVSTPVYAKPGSIERRRKNQYKQLSLWYEEACARKDADAESFIKEKLNFRL